MNSEENLPSASITNEFLEKILDKKILHFKTSEGSKPGDNFTCILISLEIYVVDREAPLHLLFKTFPSHPARQKFLQDVNMFFKEYQVYTRWLPELLKFQRSLIGSDFLVPAMPELVAGAAIDYTSNDNWKDLNPFLSNFLLMVDARKTKGFKMANKLESLSCNQVKVALDELAKYHALGYSYKMHNKLSNIRSKFPFMEAVSIYNNPSQKPLLETMFTSSLQLMVETCKDLLATRPEIAKSLEKFKDPQKASECTHMIMNANGMDEEKVEGLLRVIPSGTPLKEQWVVPSHGDFWANNILFKSDDDGNAKECFVVDLQMCRENCITVDLVDILFVSVDSAFRQKHLHEMLSWYHQRFSHFCHILKAPLFPEFSLDNFQRKFHRSKLLGFFVSCIALPILLQRSETTIDLNSTKRNEQGNADEGENEFASLFQNTGRDDEDLNILRKRLTDLLAELYDDGIL